MKYSLNDICIVPADVSNIDSRKECNPFQSNEMLPLFTAPMSSVVGLENYSIYKENKIEPIIPRTVSIDIRLLMFDNVWCAFSLDEFLYIIDNYNLFKDKKRLFVSIDIANGHMLRLHNAIIEGRVLYGDVLTIMAGNIANPETYKILSECGANYVRVGIGGGSVCITSSNTAIHYPMASLIKECYEISLGLKNPAAIIADGGIKGYGDIIKCLALGADYVMCGSVFNKMLESSGYTYKKPNDYDKLVVDQYSDSVLHDFKCGVPFFKRHLGMSTKKAQIELGSDKLKTSEGIEKEYQVEYTISQYAENISDYIKSAMSYTSAISLYDFIGHVDTIIISNNSFNSINK